MRNHEPITLEEFNGLWKRGDAESTPKEYFSECGNLEYLQGGFKSRSGIDLYKAYPNVVRMYTYNQPNDQGLLILDSSGNIYHTESPTPLVPILTIPLMTDFAVAFVSGRAYLSPNNAVLGLEGEFVYVYMGDGTYARKAAGPGPTGGSFAAANSGTAGNVEPGVHVFGVVYETNTGFLTKIGDGLVSLTVPAPGDKKVDLSGINVSPNGYVIARRIVASRAIDPTLYTGDKEGYQLFFVPDGRIEDNTSTTLAVNFYDADLIEDASYLLDILEEIPAGVNLGFYHNRMVTLAEFGEEDPDPLESTIGNMSLARVSVQGQPEAFNAVDGLIITPLDSKPLTAIQEYRDVMYLFKETKTYAYNDNGDVPSSWPLTIIDEGTGCPIHGIANVLDSGGINIDWIILTDWSGIMMFNGAFQRPELSWVIEDLWLELDRDEFKKIHILNSSIRKYLYIVLPDGTMLTANYANGLSPDKIRFTPWSFEIFITAIALVNTDELILAADSEI